MGRTYDDGQVDRDIALSGEADAVAFHFEPSRREFLQVLGAGLMIAVATSAFGQAEGGGRGGGRGGRGGGGIGGTPAANLAARLHIDKNGLITVLCGKVECGQGVRAEVTQAAAEELRVPPGRVTVILADTGVTPNDGATVGSASTPRTIPAVRQAAAAARDLLTALAVNEWTVPAAEVELREGRVIHGPSRRELTYADLAGKEDVAGLFARSQAPRDVLVTAVKEWKVLGTPLPRPNAADVVTGRHAYPSDIQRPGMVYGKILRAPGYNHQLASLDVADAEKIAGVRVVRDGAFAGVVAPSTAVAQKAVEALVFGARWTASAHPASKDLPEYLVKNARNVPEDRFAAEAKAAAKVVAQSYYLPYVQHAPMEPRAAVAEWADGKVTVWTATQNPFSVRDEVARAFSLAADGVRVIVPDFGGAFGGKHTGECAVEAARLAKAAGRPVSLRWTREEEFTWAYFRPAGVMQARATLSADGRITSWYFVNINSGPSAVQTPYNVPNLCQTVNSQPPLRHGSYRGLAATANAFARECFMDELAEAAGKDPLAFRLAHLEGADVRLRDVLEAVARRFNWAERSKPGGLGQGVGVGIACAVEKGSYTATAAEVAVDAEGAVHIRQIAHVFECGAILNPAYLLSQVQGAIVQGLGPILREEMVFAEGRMENASFADYGPPRFADVPPMDVHLLNRPDLPSAGAGETPLISVAPAVANAASRAAGRRFRRLPLRGEAV